ncbi:MAG: restriction endonuclease subunit S [Akkermansia sp.]|nr:restriction endonuclease subunit S [Akkermansia sp.]
MSKQYLKEHAGEYPVYSSQTERNGIFGNIDTYDYQGEYLTWTTDGANAGSVFYRNGKFSITNVCGLLKVKSSHISIRYLYYILRKYAPKHVSKGMGNYKLMSHAMSVIKIPVPSLEEQTGIVKLLDRFEALCTDLTAGLPAEIEARKKQYEYYRDKLLTFTPLAES